MYALKEYGWLNYIRHLKKQPQVREHFLLTGFEEFLLANRFAYQFFSRTVPVLFLLDYQSGLYIHMSENFAGYQAELFLKRGIDHTVEIYHKDHLRLFDSEIFPDRLRLLGNITPSSHKNYIFSHNLSIRNKCGKYENYMQKNCFFSDQSGYPLYSMGILFAINDFQPPNSVIQTVEYITNDKYEPLQPVSHKIYFTRNKDNYFSRREIEVLSWMAEGLSSKQIAGKLCLSEHTIISHRRNMQEKSNTPNATALVSFAIRKKII